MPIFVIFFDPGNRFGESRKAGINRMRVRPCPLCSMKHQQSLTLRKIVTDDGSDDLDQKLKDLFGDD